MTRVSDAGIAGDRTEPRFHQRRRTFGRNAHAGFIVALFARTPEMWRGHSMLFFYRDDTVAGDILLHELVKSWESTVPSLRRPPQASCTRRREQITDREAESETVAK